MVSALSCELKTCTLATCSAWASGHFSAAILLLVVGVTPTGNRDAGKFAQGNPPAAAYAPRELDDHSFGPEDIASMSAAFEAP
jgi:hypothetical protein